MFFKLKEKYDMKNEFFGLKKLLSTEEFNSFYLATGIDVDGRMEMIKKAIEQIQHGIMKYISFARIIPGFEDLPTDDKMALIKGEYVISISWGNKIAPQKGLKLQYLHWEQNFKHQL